MHHGHLIDAYSTKESWNYVVEVVDIIETRAKVSIKVHSQSCILISYLFISNHIYSAAVWLKKLTPLLFLPARRYAQRVCLSVCLSRAGIVSS